MSAAEFRRFVEEIFGAPTAVVTPNGPPAPDISPEAGGNRVATDRIKAAADRAEKRRPVTTDEIVVVDRGETVRSRVRPDYAALGLRAGAFMLFPELSVTEIYDDNVYLDSRGEEADFITVLRPNLRLISNWNRHALEAELGGALGFYARISDEDYQDVYAKLDGRVDVSALSQIRAGVAFRKLHSERDSPDDTDALRPTEYYSYATTADYIREFGRIKLTVGGEIERLDYLDNEQLGPGGVIEFNNDDRDRLETYGRARAAYVFNAGSNIYLESRFGRIDYDAGRDDNLDPISAVDRDSMDYRTVVGIESDLDGIVFGNVYAGYIRRDFDDRDLSTIEGFTVGGKVTWNVTPLTTVVADAGRTISTTTISNASGAIVTEAGVAVDHELLRNVILQFKTRWKESDYDGIERVDDTFKVGVAADVLLNRNFTLSADYTHAERLSDSSADEYSQNLLLLSLKAKF